MAKQSVSRVHFADGCVIEKDYIYVAAKLDDLDPEEYDFSRLYFFDVNRWIHHDLKFDIKSVCLRLGSGKRQYCALSMQGDVEFQFKGGTAIEKIPGAGTRNGAGAMSQIREVGDDLVACGYNAQVYHRTTTGWVSIAAGLAEFQESGQPVDLNSIDGSSLSNVFAVGYFGRIFHFDGQLWTELESPTNVHLERVRVKDGKVFVCGNDGTLLIGDLSGFVVHDDPVVTEHLWSVEVFQSKVYLAGLQQLYVFDGKKLGVLSTGLKPEVDGYRLDARDGVLWSFGATNLAWTDGNKWHRVDHPDNP